MRQQSLSLFIDHQVALVDYASGIIGDRASGEDVVQEAWLRFDAVARGRLLEEPLGYLYRVVRNLALDWQRKSRRERLLIVDDGLGLAEASPDERPSPETAMLYKSEYGLVMDAIAELPERTRIALEMHRFGGAKLKEIAAVLGISLPMAHVLVADGVRHCKKRVGWP